MKQALGVFLFFLLVILTGCAQAQEQQGEKAGVLIPYPIDDQGWNSKGYQAALSIQSKFDNEVLIKEDIRARTAVKEAVKKFSDEGTGLIIGHSHLYADMFMELKEDYPHIHFVSINGEAEGANITSLHFDGYAMGYFAGMIAAEMSETGKVGVIAAFPFQPEVEGFEDGALYHAPETLVKAAYVNSWADGEKAVEQFDEMEADGVDIFYPAGDGFHVSVIEAVKAEGLYAIGYVGDQIDLGEATVLTSTVQNVDNLYDYAADAFLKGDLESGNQFFDFPQYAIELGEFSPLVPEETQEWINGLVERYIDTGNLPHEN